MESNAALRRNFFWNTLGSVVYMGCQWLFTVLAARLSLAGMADTNSGYLNTALVITNIFLSLASYGMYNFQVSDAKPKYSPSVYIRSRVFTCCLTVVACMGYVGLTSALGDAPYSVAQCLCIFLVLAYRLVESVTDVYNAVYQKHGRLDLVGKTYLVRGVLSVGLFTVGLLLTGNLPITLALMLAGNLLFFALSTLPAARQFYAKGAASRRQVAALLAECLPLAVYTVLNTTTASVPKIFLERMLGTQAIGIYGPVTAPVLLLQTGATYLFIPFLNSFVSSWESKDKKSFFKMLLRVEGIILLLLPIGFLVAKFLGPWGLRIIQAQYVAYAYLLAPMVISAVLTATVLFFSMVLTVMRKPRVLLAANGAGIVVAFGVSALCINQWGLQGTTYAAICALCVQVACLLVGLLYYVRKHFTAQREQA